MRFEDYTDYDDNADDGVLATATDRSEHIACVIVCTRV